MTEEKSKGQKFVKVNEYLPSVAEESTFGNSYRNVPSFDKASVKSQNKFESNSSICTCIYR